MRTCLSGPAKDPWGNQKVSVVLETNISRTERGLIWNVRSKRASPKKSLRSKLRSKR